MISSLVGKLSLCFAKTGNNRPKTRLEIRQEWEKQQKLRQQTHKAEFNARRLRDDEESQKMYRFKPDESGDYIRDNAAVQIQRIIRGFLGRIYAEVEFNVAMQEANDYWLGLYREAENQRKKAELAILVRKQLTRRYVTNFIDISVMYVSELDDASLTIQRTWRGHWVRCHLPRRPTPTIPRPPRKFKPKGHFSMATLRRIWARTVFEPSLGGYLHMTDVGYEHYDSLFAYSSQPPDGHEHGLRTRKVILPAQTAEEEFVSAADRHAWLAVPVGPLQDTITLNRLRMQRRQAQIEAIFKDSPYLDLILPEYLKRKPRAVVAQDSVITQQTMSITAPSLHKGPPPVGDIAYDSSTGRQLRYLGQGRYRRLFTGLEEEKKSHRRIDSMGGEPLPLATTVLLEADGEDQGDLFRSHQLSLSSQHAVPKVLKSGQLSITNPALQTRNTPSPPGTANRGFLKIHAVQFERRFTHRKPTTYNNSDSVRDSEGSGLVSYSRSYGRYLLTHSFFNKNTKPNMNISISSNNKEEKGLTAWQEGVRLATRKDLQQASSTFNSSQFNHKHSRNHSTAAQRQRQTLKQNNLQLLTKSLVSDSDLRETMARMEILDRQQRRRRRLLQGDDDDNNDDDVMDESIDNNSPWLRPEFPSIPDQQSLPTIAANPYSSPNSKHHYKQRLSWLPQPLLCNATNQLYYQRSYASFKEESLAMTQDGESIEEAGLLDKKSMMLNAAPLSPSLSFVTRQQQEKETKEWPWASLHSGDEDVDEDDSIGSPSKSSPSKSQAQASPKRIQLFYTDPDNDDNNDLEADNNRSAAANTLRHPLRQVQVNLKIEGKRPHTLWASDKYQRPAYKQGQHLSNDSNYTSALSSGGQDTQRRNQQGRYIPGATTNTAADDSSSVLSALSSSTYAKSLLLNSSYNKLNKSTSSLLSPVDEEGADCHFDNNKTKSMSEAQSTWIRSQRLLEHRHSFDSFVTSAPVKRTIPPVARQPAEQATGMAVSSLQQVQLPRPAHPPAMRDSEDKDSFEREQAKRAQQRTVHRKFQYRPAIPRRASSMSSLLTRDAKIGTTTAEHVYEFR